MVRRVTKLTKGHMVRSNIGERHWRSQLSEISDSFDYKKYIDKYTSDIRDNIKKGRGLFFWGKHGHGKTSCAVICMKAALVNYFTSYLIRCDSIQNTYISKLDFDDDQTVIERCMSCDLLVMDDLGMEHIKEFGNSLIEGLVRERSSKGKSVIITSNLSPKDIGKNYGEGVKSILTEMCFAVPVDGKNWRSEISKEVSNYFKG